MKISSERLIRWWWSSLYLSMVSFTVVSLLVYSSPILIKKLVFEKISYLLDFIPMVVFTLGLMGFLFGFLLFFLSIIIRQRIVKIMKKSVIEILGEKYGKTYFLRRFFAPLIIGVIMFFNLWIAKLELLSINWAIGIGFLLCFLLFASLIYLFIPIMQEFSLILKQDKVG